MYGLNLTLRLPAIECMWTTGLTDTSSRLAFFVISLFFLHIKQYMVELNMLPAKQEIITTGTGKTPNQHECVQSPYCYTINLWLHTHCFRSTLLPFATHSSLCCTLAFVLEDQSTLCHTWNLCHSFNFMLNSKNRILRAHAAFFYTFNWLYWLITIRVTSGRC